MRIGAFLATVFVTLYVIGLKSHAETVGSATTIADAKTLVERPQALHGCADEAKKPLKSWSSYGTIGPSCAAENQGDALRASVLYPNFIIDWKKIVVSKKDNKDDITDDGHQHIKQYAVNVLNLIDQMGSDFLKKRAIIEQDLRRRELSDEELSSWQRFLEIVGYQESLYSQYQREDNDKDNVSRLRITVGDPLFLHDRNGNIVRDGHGPVQAKDERGNPIYQSKGMFQLLASLNSPLAKHNFDLVLNIENGLETLYKSWARILGYQPMEKWLAADFARCRSLIYTSSGVNYQNVLRAAYGMYNGGDAQICRFAESDRAYTKYREENPMCDVGQVAFKGGEAEKQRCESRQSNGHFAYPWVNDIRIAQLSKDLRWEAVLNTSLTARAHMRSENPNWLSFDLDCARHNGRFCLRAKDSGTKLNSLLANDVDGKLFTLDVDPARVGHEDSFCVYNKAKRNFTCTRQERWVSCLRPSPSQDRNHVTQAYYTLHMLPLDESDPLVHFEDDPRKLCGNQNVASVFVTGDYVRALQALPVRKTADMKSPTVATFAQGATVQVLDFDLNPRAGIERWYKIEIAKDNGQRVDGFVYGGDDQTWSRFLVKAKGAPSLADVVIPDIGDQIQLNNGGTSCTIKDLELTGDNQTIYGRLLDDSGQLNWVRLGQIGTNADNVGDSLQFHLLGRGGSQ